MFTKRAFSGWWRGLAQRVSDMEARMAQMEAHVLTTKMRFVPFSNMINEPPCAGTDYKP
jgi:hypothetical protein